ncbi:hypothetical protein D3C81_2335600 [compost metagenome]
MCRSEPQIPQASVLTSTSPCPGVGAAMESTTSCLSRMTTAFMKNLPVRFGRRDPATRSHQLN